MRVYYLNNAADKIFQPFAAAAAYRKFIFLYLNLLAKNEIRFFLPQVLITYSSTYVLVALSIDRYDAITRPMKFSGSCKDIRNWQILFTYT